MRCNSLAYVQSVNAGIEYMTGCMATCPDASERLLRRHGLLPGGHPAQGINTYGMQFDDRFNTASAVTGFSPCSYAGRALMEAAAFDFRTTYVTTGDFMTSTGGKVQLLLLDWVVSRETCREAARNATAYMCVSGNSERVDSWNGPGYLPTSATAPRPLRPCRILTSNNKYPCSVPGTCTNTPGSFICSCPDNHPRRRQVAQLPHRRGLRRQGVRLRAGDLRLPS